MFDVKPHTAWWQTLKCAFKIPWKKKNLYPSVSTMLIL